MRIATITLAAPWPDNVMSGMFNRHQPHALNQMGHQAEVFVMSPQYPRILEKVRPSLKRFRDRPTEYEFMDVKYHVIKGLVAHPVWTRWRISPKFPRLAGRLISWNVERRLLAALRKYQPEGLLIHDTILNGALGARLSRKLGVPFVTVDHDPIDMPPDSPMGRLFKRVGRQARAIFNVGSLGYLHIRDALKLSNVRLLPNGSVRASEEQRRTPRPAKWEGKKVVLCVGVFIERKAHKELLRAFAEANVPDAVLVMVGDPPKAVVDLVAELKLGEKVEFIPFMSQQEVQQYMVWADLFALPSWWEAFGLVYVEAMSAETPPIMSQDCGLTFVMEQGVNGWVVPPQDHGALVSVLREALTKADLKAMGQRGRVIADTQFIWPKNAELVVAGLRGEPDPLPPIPDIRLPTFRPAYFGN